MARLKLSPQHRQSISPTILMGFMIFLCSLLIVGTVISTIVFKQNCDNVFSKETHQV